MPQDLLRFGFGKNWQRFIQQYFSDERVELSQKHLLDFLQMSDLEGKYFLDVGCGSGLHSLAALRAGAARVMSFDVDEEAVNTTSKLKQYAGNPAHWLVRQGSILDEAFLQTIEPADLVYAWGVLHHSGNMWQAFKNTSRLLKEGGLLFVALYTDAPYFDLPMAFWLEVKQRYNRVGWLTKKKMVAWYIWEFYLHKQWRALPDLFKQAREYKARGMELYTDVIDWLGGWPMEVAPVEEVQRFGVEQLGLTLVNIKTGQANAEYLFGR